METLDFLFSRKINFSPQIRSNSSDEDTEGTSRHVSVAVLDVESVVPWFSGHVGDLAVAILSVSAV